MDVQAGQLSLAGGGTSVGGQFNGSGTLTNVMSRVQIAADGGLFYVLPTEDEWYKAAYLKSDGSGYTLYATGDSIPTAGAGGENYNNAIGSVWNVGSGTASSIENNGTFDMNGNVWEWNESTWDGTLDSMDENRVVRGGTLVHNESFQRSSHRTNYYPTNEYDFIGFRVAAIPEPSVIALMGVFGGGLWFVRKFFPSV